MNEKEKKNIKLKIGTKNPESLAAVYIYRYFIKIKKEKVR